jgi:hypothetical protein
MAGVRAEYAPTAENILESFFLAEVMRAHSTTPLTLSARVRATAAHPVEYVRNMAI